MIYHHDMGILSDEYGRKSLKLDKWRLCNVHIFQNDMQQYSLQYINNNWVFVTNIYTVYYRNELWTYKLASLSLYSSPRPACLLTGTPPKFPGSPLSAHSLHELSHTHTHTYTFTHTESLHVGANVCTLSAVPRLPKSGCLISQSAASLVVTEFGNGWRRSEERGGRKR